MSTVNMLCTIANAPEFLGEAVDRGETMVLIIINKIKYTHTQKPTLQNKSIQYLKMKNVTLIVLAQVLGKTGDILLIDENLDYLSQVLHYLPLDGRNYPPAYSKACWILGLRRRYQS